MTPDTAHAVTFTEQEQATLLPIAVDGVVTVTRLTQLLISRHKDIRVFSPL